MSSPHRLAALVVLAGAASVFALRPAARLYENRDVPRYAQMAYEMRHAGTLVPMFNGAPYHEAMPIAGQAPYAVAWLQGEVTPLTARVVPMLATWLMVAATLAFVARRGGAASPEDGGPGSLRAARRALLAAGIAVLTNLAHLYARESRVEAPLALCVTAAIAAFVEGAEAAGGARLIWYGLAGLAAAGAVAFKGPAAVTIAAALGPAFLLLRRWRPIVEGGAVATAVAAAATAAWVVPYRDYLGPEEWQRFWDQFVGRETLEKIESGYGKAEPFLQYFWEVPLNFLPWSVPALVGLARVLRRPGGAAPLEVVAVAWVIFPLLVFSAAKGKHIRYFVPMVPAFAILAAYEIDRWIERRPATGERWLWIATFWVCALSFAGGLAAPVGVGVATGEWSAWAFAVGLSTAAAGLFGIAFGRHGRYEAALAAAFLAGAGALTFYYAALLPLPGAQARSSAHIHLAQAVAPLVRPEEPLAVLNPPTLPGHEIVEASLLALYLEHLQGKPRWVDIARRDALPRAGLLLTKPPVPGEVVAVIPWARHRREPPELWLLVRMRGP